MHRTQIKGELETDRLLEHDPEKWKPVFRKDHARKKELERDLIASCSRPN